MKWQDKRMLMTSAGGFIGNLGVDELLHKGAYFTSCAQFYKIFHIASNDKDSSRVPLLSVWKPHTEKIHLHNR